MLTDREIVAVMQEANPLPEPHLLPDDAAGFDLLLEKISKRRVPMLSTPETRTEEAQAIPSPDTIVEPQTPCGSGVVHHDPGGDWDRRIDLPRRRA